MTFVVALDNLQNGVFLLLYAFDYIHNNHSCNHISPHDCMPVLHIIFIFLFIISVYNLDFYEIDPKCLASNKEKTLGKQTWKTGDRNIVSSPTHFNFICDNSEMIFMRNAWWPLSISHEDALRDVWWSPNVSHEDALRNAWWLLSIFGKDK